MERLLKPLIFAIAFAAPPCMAAADNPSRSMRVDYERWGKVVKASGAKVE